MNRPSPIPEPAPKVIKNRGQSRMRVRYCECDPMGVAHHSSYVPWLEIGRTELLRDCGVTYAQMESSGTFLVIVKLDLRYRRPVKYDDLVEVRTHWIGGSRIKIEHSYEVIVVERGGVGVEEMAAAGSTTLACVDSVGKVRELPEWLVTARE